MNTQEQSNWVQAWAQERWAHACSNNPQQWEGRRQLLRIQTGWFQSSRLVDSSQCVWLPENTLVGLAHEEQDMQLCSINKQWIGIAYLCVFVDVYFWSMSCLSGEFRYPFGFLTLWSSAILPDWLRNFLWSGLSSFKWESSLSASFFFLLIFFPTFTIFVY